MSQVPHSELFRVWTHSMHCQPSRASQLRNSGYCRIASQTTLSSPDTISLAPSSVARLVGRLVSRCLQQGSAEVLLGPHWRGLLTRKDSEAGLVAAIMPRAPAPVARGEPPWRRISEAKLVRPSAKAVGRPWTSKQPNQSISSSEAKQQETGYARRAFLASLCID
jgi:hypothetical protein